jgi:hypothetical protein
MYPAASTGRTVLAVLFSIPLRTTTVVTVEPDVSDTEEETGTCTFHESTGQFKLVASTPGENGEVRAESILYNIVPGSPAVGVITLSPS